MLEVNTRRWIFSEHGQSYLRAFLQRFANIEIQAFIGTAFDESNDIYGLEHINHHT